ALSLPGASFVRSRLPDHCRRNSRACTICGAQDAGPRRHFTSYVADVLPGCWFSASRIAKHFPALAGIRRHVDYVVRCYLRGADHDSVGKLVNNAPANPSCRAGPVRHTRTGAGRLLLSPGFGSSEISRGSVGAACRGGYSLTDVLCSSNLLELF